MLTTFLLLLVPVGVFLLVWDVGRPTRPFF